MDKRHHELKSFFEEAFSNEEIKGQLTGHKTLKSFQKEVVKQGRKLGYSISEEDVQRAIVIRQNRELQDNELAMVKGGAGADQVTASLLLAAEFTVAGAVTCIAANSDG